MGKLAIKYGSLINLFAGEFWYLFNIFKKNDYGPEPLILLITGLVLFIVMEYQEQTKVDPTDKKLFHEFLENLPYEGGISFIDSTDMSEAVYDPQIHDDLRNFYLYWDNAAHEFINKKIEKRRRYLWELVESYIVALDTYTVPATRGKRRVSPELKEKEPERWQEIIDDFHYFAGQIVLAHQDFIRYAKNKLKMM